MGEGGGAREGLGINAFLHRLNPNDYTKINTTQLYFFFFFFLFFFKFFI